MTPQAELYRSKKGSFTGRIFTPAKTSILIIHRGENADIGRYCALQGKFYLFPGRALYIAIDELGELSDFCAELQVKFTPLSALEPAKFTPLALPNPETDSKAITGVNSTREYHTSKGVACKCSGTKEEKKKHWAVIQYKCNHSAFSGYKFTPSDYSQVKCSRCGNTWRSKLSYVEELPRHHSAG